MLADAVAWVAKEAAFQLARDGKETAGGIGLTVNTVTPGSSPPRWSPRCRRRHLPKSPARFRPVPSRIATGPPGWCTASPPTPPKSPAKCGWSTASSTCDPRPNHPPGGQGFEPNDRRFYAIDEDSGLAGVGLRGCDIDARPAGFGHGVTHSAGGRRRFHTLTLTGQARPVTPPAPVSGWPAPRLDLLQALRCERFLEETSTPHAPVHMALTVALDPGPAGATVQLVSMVELASFSDDGVAGDVDAALYIANPGLGGLQRPVGDHALTLAALQHLLVAVVRGLDFRPDMLVVGDGSQHGRRLGVDQDAAGYADLSHQAKLLCRVVC